MFLRFGVVFWHLGLRLSFVFLCALVHFGCQKCRNTKSTKTPKYPQYQNDQNAKMPNLQKCQHYKMPKSANLSKCQKIPKCQNTKITKMWTCKNAELQNKSEYSKCTNYQNTQKSEKKSLCVCACFALKLYIIEWSEEADSAAIIIAIARNTDSVHIEEQGEESYEQGPYEYQMHVNFFWLDLIIF